MKEKLTGWLIGSGRDLLKQVEVEVENGHALYGMREQLGISEVGGLVDHLADVVKDGEDVWCAEDAYDVYSAAAKNDNYYPVVKFEDDNGNVLASVFGFALLLGYTEDGDTCSSTLTFEEVDSLLSLGRIKVYEIPVDVMRKYL